MAFSGSGKIWMNGSLVDWADAKIHVASHVIHYGSAVFEGARCYATPRGSACFRLDAHMRRLYDSAKIYRMEPAIDLEALTDAVLETIRANEFKACYIRPIVYRGYEELGVNPFPCPVDSAILTWEWGAYLGDEAIRLGADVRISSWSRAALNTFPTLAKSSANYANSQLIKMEAIAEGYSEGIALDTQGQPERRQRPEPVPGPRRRAVHAVDGGGDSSGHHPRHGDHAGAGPRLHGARRACCRASCSTSRTRRSSSARRPRSRRSARWTRSRSARASAPSPRRCAAPSSTSSTARCPTATTG